jgi:thioredoxin reductase (NADPH)
MSKKANGNSHDSTEVKNLYDVIIIGSGPAGFTAGVYTSREKLKTLIISGSLPGGQLMTTIEVENYPGFPNGIFGPELMMNMRQQD